MKDLTEVLGYPGYSVSREGDVYSTKRYPRGKKLAGHVYNTGYRMVTLRDLEGKQHYEAIHRLVALAFLDNREELPAVNHKDGDKLNNAVDNLEWCTYAHNTAHMVENGLRERVVGVAKRGQVLEESTVRRIKKDLAQGVTVKDLADKYNCSTDSIQHIKGGRSWKHIQV